MSADWKTAAACCCAIMCRRGWPAADERVIAVLMSGMAGWIDVSLAAVVAVRLQAHQEVGTG